MSSSGGHVTPTKTPRQRSSSSTNKGKSTTVNGWKSTNATNGHGSDQEHPTNPLLEQRVLNKIADGIAQRMELLGFLRPVLAASNGDGGTSKVRTPRAGRSPLHQPSNGHSDQPEAKSSKRKTPKTEPKPSSAISPSPRKSKLLPPKRLGRSSATYDETRFMNAQVIVTAIKPNPRLAESKQRFSAQVFLNTNDVRLYHEIVGKFNGKSLEKVAKDETDKQKIMKKRRVVISRGKKIGGIITSKRMESLVDSSTDRVSKIERILTKYGYATDDDSIVVEDLTRMAQIRDGINVILSEQLIRYKRSKTESDCEADALDIEVDDDSDDRDDDDDHEEDIFDEEEEEDNDQEENENRGNGQNGATENGQEDNEFATTEEEEEEVIDDPGKNSNGSGLLSDTESD